VTPYLQFAASVAGKQSDRHVVERSPALRSPYDRPGHQRAFQPTPALFTMKVHEQ
jgi:hypothetical protein